MKLRCTALALTLLALAAPGRAQTFPAVNKTTLAIDTSGNLNTGFKVQSGQTIEWLSGAAATFDAGSTLTVNGTANFFGATLTLPSSFTWAGTLPIANGGTGVTSATLGDLNYGSGTNTRAVLAGNTAATKKFLTQTGTGTVSAAPAWSTIADGDLPSALTGKTYNGLTVTSTTGTFTLTNAKVFSVTDNITLSSDGTGPRTLNIGAGGTLGALATLTPGTGVAPALGNAVNTTGGVTTIDGTATLTNKTIVSDVITPASDVSGLYILPHYVLASNQMTLAVSMDGITFVDVYADTYAGPTGLCKDQSPLFLNGAWYMVYTCADASGKFGVAKSLDLKTWAEVTEVAVGVNTNKCWAPELFVDSDGSINVAVALSTDGGSTFTLYGTTATNAALSAWTTPTQFFTTNAIDPFIFKEGGTYYLWYVNASTNPGYIEVASASSLFGTYTRIKTGDWAGWGAVGEGVCVLKRAAGDYLVYVDFLGAGYYHYASSSSLLSGWSGMTAVNYLPFTSGRAPKHGTVYAIKNLEAERAVIGALAGRLYTSLAGANPSVTIGTTATNGTAYTFMRSDAAPAIDQTMSPTWTGNHTFSVNPINLNSGQILFPATQNPSSNAHALDDYAEGTFSPSVVGSTSAGTASYTVQFGRYTKIGRLVHAEVRLIYTSGTGTGNLQIAGLPYTSASGNGYPACSIYVSDISLTSGNIAQALVLAGSTTIEINQTPVGGGTVTLVPYDAAGAIIVTAVYTAAN